MRYQGERAGDEWAGDMPKMSEIEIPMRKAPLSAEQKRKGNRAGEGRSRRSKREEASVFGVGKRVEEQREVSKDQKGQGEHAETRSELSDTTSECGGSRDGRGLDGDFGKAQSPMLLLQEDQGANDAGPCDSPKQRGQELAGEYRPSLQIVQQPEARQNVDALLVGCPGCKKCEKYHGYLFHLSAGRCTKAHEYIFLLTKSERYYFDAEAIAEPLAYGSAERLSQPNIESQAGSDRVPGKTNGNMKAVYKKPYENESTKDYANGGAQDASATKARIVDRILSGDIITRNKRSVWTVTTKPFKGAHFATFPVDLIQPCILAGSKSGDTILDPFGGSGTTGQVAIELGRSAMLCELNPEYVKLIEQRTDVTPGLAL